MEHRSSVVSPKPCRHQLRSSSPVSSREFPYSRPGRVVPLPVRTGPKGYPSDLRKARRRLSNELARAEEGARSVRRIDCLMGSTRLVRTTHPRTQECLLCRSLDGLGGWKHSRPVMGYPAPSLSSSGVGVQVLIDIRDFLSPSTTSVFLFYVLVSSLSR